MKPLKLLQISRSSRKTGPSPEGPWGPERGPQRPNTSTKTHLSRFIPFLPSTRAAQARHHDDRLVILTFA
eukprot:9490821-Pyramimonas_sp.AAC.1